MSEDRKALICCHTRNNYHWLADYFRLIEDYYFKTTDFSHFTVDIKSEETISEKNIVITKHYIGDAFGEKFISTHENKYNIIFMPDCGGEWFPEKNISHEIY
jgi:hypothetical protein